MLTDSERFAFIPTRIHSFETSGNAYDACQTDDAIKTGDLLLILPEKIVGLAYAWPVAVTLEYGKLLSFVSADHRTISDLMTTFPITSEQVIEAIHLARALDYPIDEMLDRLCPVDAQ
ncbi:hypothetical protein SKA58_19695 [Sphingomonas sp. SKA58]|uniref:hypothetical protein n=1 Tax=Sphingomonas sp. (strain SKA58) TaxID=314266 RepID=UPI0000D7AE26|nr:hypothetical protein [Sphingomonas sp. SKA58]EAT07488.1 hypothetical protein SKA58_19695 [Sphingomonas sp. SKA58]